jgi:DNA-binding protein HU-beta
MNKNEFIDKLTEKTGLSKKASKESLEATLEIITEALVEKDTVSFIGFGTFSTVDRDARTARVPGTKKEVHVPAKTICKFKVGKALKDAVEKG